MSEKIRMRFIGWVPQPGVEEREYRDYVNSICTMWLSEFRINLNTGNLPPGLCVLPDGGIPGLIVGRGADQHIRPVIGVMRT